jgi:hypothetical protein
MAVFWAVAPLDWYEFTSFSGVLTACIIRAIAQLFRSHYSLHHQGYCPGREIFKMPSIPLVCYYLTEECQYVQLMYSCSSISSYGHTGGNNCCLQTYSLYIYIYKLGIISVVKILKNRMLLVPAASQCLQSQSIAICTAVHQTLIWLWQPQAARNSKLKSECILDIQMIISPE